MKTKLYPQWLRLAAGLTLLLAALTPVSPVYADSCVVTTDADSGAGSLREKIADPVCETITFDGDYTILLTSSLAIGRNMTIDGVGHSVTVSRNSSIAVQLLVVNAGATVSLNNLTVADGRHGEWGGGIFNSGTLNLANVTISRNWTMYCGGGIVNTGVLTVIDSTFSENIADFGSGGAICNCDGTLYVTGSTFYDNLGIWAGSGILNYDPATLYVTNSTFSRNISTDAAISNDGMATVTNSTISGNVGAGFENSGTATVVNTIVANNVVNNILANCTQYGGTLTVSSSLADDESCGPGFYSPSILLASLADNGGPTQTMALLPGSTAIDAGDDTVCPATDQRGVARPYGAHCDIGAYEAEITVDNTAPTANPGGPYLGAVNASIAFDGSLSSDPDGDLLTYAWTFGDGGTATDAMPTHSYAAAGIYDVCLTVNDGSLDSEPACTLEVLYDPSAGFVTGGGWISSPAGAYKPDETLAGKATFGFISKYQKGASIPTGNTAFEFDLAGLAFSSTSYEWLVVNQGGTNAQFKGSGLINGTADPNGNAYKFMLWASDGSPDTFRIRIWWEDNAGEHDVYDNGVAQPINAGNIVVHTGK